MLLAEDNDFNAEIATNFSPKRSGPPTASPASIDTQLPITDDYSAAPKIRWLHDAAKAYLPTIATTANAFAEDCCKAPEVVMNEYVTKSIDMNVLPSIERHLKPLNDKFN